ncbi:lipoprotein signal peptidase [Neobacillus notoginsengisoli]|uniref:Lipoprotein signal peptidase n=1 Tax=Neobacillus notoginsengisoli TaxID=1578198 RepID=A0A417YR78_9BACI|nr:signal peptidase II [Neobacillus notoginsengisoli]RHW36478.1 lipoprotein signal peptidase [Neobacillus notoginsengisoli]
MFYYLIAAFIIILDQITKWLIVKNMNIGDSIPIIEDFLYITSHRNRGAAWGILQGQMWLFYVITVIVIIGIVYYINKAAKGNALLGVSLGFMLGGAIGNFIDRVYRQEVVDFIHTYIFSYNFPVFNIADSALVIGVFFLMIQMLKEEREAKKEKSYGKNGTHHP